MKAQFVAGLMFAVACPVWAADWLVAPVAETRAAAEAGDVAAQQALGERLLHGRDGRTDVAEAYRWTERAAEAGSLEARLRLGMRREQGIGCPVDVDLAREYYQRAADQGEPGAALALARVWSSRQIGAQHDTGTALNWLRTAVASGAHEAQWRFAAVTHPKRGADPALVPERRRALEILAQAGDTAAQGDLGSLLVTGTMSRPEVSETALYWLQLALTDAKASGEAQRWQRLYLNAGLRTLPPEKVTEVTRRVAAFKPAPVRLLAPGVQSALHLDGPRPPQCASAESLARFAQVRERAEQGEVAAQFQLALTWHHSDGWEEPNLTAGGLTIVNGRVANASPTPVPKHLVDAARWYRAAITNGSAEAATHLGYMAVNGQLNEADLKFAVGKVQTLAEAGDAFAQHQLGNLHLAGRGVATNRVEAVRLLTRAAEGKLREAMYQLGLLHHAGSLVPQDLGEAARWLRQAAQAGDLRAIRQMSALFGQTVTATNGAAGRPASVSQPPPRKAARLALVPVADALRPAADLFTATLSTLPGMELVERAEIDRVIREQSLAATLAREPLKLGRLLGADGLVLLETNVVGDAVMADARLVAVGPGVVLGEWLIPFPVPEVAGWSARVAADAAPLFRKLAVPRGQATPVSVLGLRMAVNVPDAAAVSQGLSRLLSHRLTQEPELFVLERKLLNRLGAEKSLVADGDASFWSGSHLLDGSIEPDLNVPGRLQVQLVLTSPGNSPVTFTVGGSRTDLALLAETLAGRVLTALRMTSTVSWRPETEAQRFLEEATWARRWSQWEPALNAMESAWALGLRGPSHAELRQKLLLENLRFAGRPWSGTTNYPPLLRQPPEVANLDLIARALAGYLDHTRAQAAAARTNNPGWLALGAGTLEMSGRVIEEFYFAPEYWPGRTEQLAQLRSEMRALHALLGERLAEAQPRAQWDTLEYKFRQAHFDGRSGPVGLLPLEVRFLRFWAERPEEVLALHTRLQGQPDYGYWRPFFQLALPTPLVAWDVAGRARLPELWANHAQALTSATNLPGLFEHELGLMQTVPSSPWTTVEPKLTEAFRRLLDFAWIHREGLARHAAGPHTISSLLAACRARFQYYHGTTGHEPAGQRLEAVVASGEKRLRDYQGEVGLSLAKALLAETTPPDESRFNDLIAGPNFSQTQARELLPLVRAYAERFRFAPVNLGSGLKRVAELAEPPALAGTTNAAPVVIVPARGQPGPEALRVTRFWAAPELHRPPQAFVAFPLPERHFVERRLLDVQAWAWAEERLWLAWRHEISIKVPGTGRGDGFWVPQGCTHIAGYTLPDFAGEDHPEALPGAVALPTDNVHFQNRQPGRFAVVDGQLFAAGSNTVWRVAKAGSAPLKLPLAGLPALAAVHGRLIIAVPDELYAHDVRAGTQELLASGRRRPAANPADPGALGIGLATELPNGRMRVFFTGGGGFDYDFANRQWAAVARPPGAVLRPVGDHWSATVTSGLQYSVLRLLPDTGTNWQFASIRLPAPPGDVHAFMTGAPLAGIPLWAAADRALVPAGLAAASRSNLFWAVTGLDFHRGQTNHDTFMLAANGCHVRLAAWRKDLAQPAEIPLWLELPEGALTRLGVALTQTHNFPGKLAAAPGALLATPPGLVYRAESVPGVWFIPWADVLPRVEAQFARLAAARAARPAPGPQPGAQLLHRYDLDGDNQLNGVEFGALFFGEKLNPDVNSARTSLPNLFNAMDRNRNHVIEADEMLAGGELLRPRTPGSSPMVFRPPGFPGGGAPGSFPPRSGLPGRPGQPGQTPTGPPPPEILERYDKNRNGKMDPEEMQELLRDQLRGTAPRPRATTNSAAPAAPDSPPRPPASP